MTRVLAVDDDASFLRAIERDLRIEGLDVHPTSDGEEALEWLNREHCDVLLTDLQLNGLSGLDLLERARDLSPSTRSVLMSGCASARDYETAIELGAVRVLCKPFSKDQLIGAVRQAADCHQGFRGSIHGLGLIDLLQMFHYGQRSVLIEIDGGRNGRVYVSGGAIVHAEHGICIGEAALTQILRLPQGALRTAPLSQVPERTVHRGFNEVLLDSLRALDESASDERADAGRLAFRSLAPGAPSELRFGFSDAPSASGEDGVGERLVIMPPMPNRPPLDAVFTAAWRGTPQPSPSLSVLGLRLSRDESLSIHRGLDGRVAAPLIREQVASVRRLVGGEPRGVVERVLHGTLLYVVWDCEADLAFVLADGVRAPSEAAWLRAAAQMFARRLFGQET